MPKSDPRARRFFFSRELGLRPSLYSERFKTSCEPSDELRKGMPVRPLSELFKSPYFTFKLAQAPAKLQYSQGFAPQDIVNLSLWRASPLQHGGCVNCASWSNDLVHLATGSDDRLVKIWSVIPSRNTSLRATLETGHRGNVFCVEQSPRNKDMFYTCAMDGELRRVSVDKAIPSESVSATDNDGIMHMFKFVPQTNGNQLATAEQGGVCRFLDLRTASENSNVGTVGKISFHDSFSDSSPGTSYSADVRAIDFHPNGTLLAIGGTAGPVIHLYDRRRLDRRIKKIDLYPDEEEQRDLDNRGKSISCVKFNEEGSRLLVNVMEGSIHNIKLGGNLDYDFYDGHNPINVPGESHHMVYFGGKNCDTFLKTALFFGPREEYVVAGTDDGNALIWNTLTGSIEKKIKADSRICNGVIPHPVYPYLVTYGIDNAASVYACPPSPDLIWFPAAICRSGQPNSGRPKGYPHSREIENFVYFKRFSDSMIRGVPFEPRLIRPSSLFQALDLLKEIGNKHFKRGCLNKATEAYESIVYHVQQLGNHDSNEENKMALMETFPIKHASNRQLKYAGEEDKWSYLVQSLENRTHSAGMNKTAIVLRTLEQSQLASESLKSVYILFNKWTARVIERLTSGAPFKRMEKWLYYEQPDEGLVKEIPEFAEEVNKLKNFQLTKTHYRRGKAACVMKQYDSALNEFKLASAISPNDKVVLKNIRKVKLLLKKDKKRMRKKLSKMFK